MNKIIPYIIYNGNCREALSFYSDCLGGEIVSITTIAEAPIPMEVPPEAADRIFDAHLQAGNIDIRASDSQPGQEVNIGRNFALYVTFSTIDELEDVYSKLSVGGNIWMPVSDAPTGKFGMLADKFGIQWMLSWHKS